MLFLSSLYTRHSVHSTKFFDKLSIISLSFSTSKTILLCSDKDKFLKMIQIGLPAGIQGILFSISNVIIQSSVNTFDTIAVAGNTTGQNIEGFVYMAMNAFSQTALSFSGQNYGAHKFKRLLKVLGISLACVSVVGPLRHSADKHLLPGLDSM